MFPSDHPEASGAFLTDDSSSRIEDVSSSAILETMFEQKRRSTVPPELERDEDAVATQRLARIAPEDDVFQKIR